MSLVGKTRRTAALKMQYHDEEEDEMSNSGSFDGSNFESEDSEYQAINKRLRTFEGNNKGGSQMQRKPTRVPNMKIQNRNALLARENRKRKKEMMETLEKTVNNLQAENRRFHKIMKLKDTRINKLLREVQYLKSVISNRTEIVSILTSLPQLPTTALGKSSSSYAMNNNNNEKDGASMIGSSRSSETLSCNDLDVENVATEWDEILENPFSSKADFSEIPKLDDISSLPSFSPSSDISTEHNYSHFEEEGTKKASNDTSLPGVCLHINSGRVSLEFCSVCHFNATNSWMENSD